MHHCNQMDWILCDGETGLIYVSKFDEVGLKVEDGGSSYILLQHCPWCGTKLPESKRARWFERLEALGIEPDSGEIPNEYQSGEWYGIGGSDVDQDKERP